MKEEVLIAQREEQFEQLIQGHIDRRFGCCDDFLDRDIVEKLSANLLRFKEQGKMVPAGVGRKFDFQQNAMVRGDVIKWIEKDSQDEAEKILLQKIGQFISYLNLSCFTNLNDYEFHYASYQQGSFYKRHLDQFKSERGRKFSLVIYLNDNWQTGDGGHLSLYLDDDVQEDIYPIGGRAVFFKSDEVEHEVNPSPNRERMSIAGWLKSV